MQSEKRNSFQTGWYQVRQCDMKEVKEKIISALAIETKVQWWRMLKGLGRMLSPAEVKAIEDIFQEYKIVRVWDN